MLGDRTRIGCPLPETLLPESDEGVRGEYPVNGGLRRVVLSPLEFGERNVVSSGLTSLLGSISNVSFMPALASQP